MTVCIGYVAEDSYYMAADHCTMCNSIPTSMVDNKIYKFPDFMIGACGRVKSANILSQWKPPKRKKSDSIDRYIRTSMVKSLQKNLIKYGLYNKDGSCMDCSGLETSFLVVCEEGIYHIGIDMCVYKTEEAYGAIGSGADVAIGALALYHATAEDDTYPCVKNVLADIINICAKHCHGVNNHFTVLSKEVL